MIEFCVLGSGSKGNAVYLKINNYSFLFDCGLSCKQVEARLDSVGVNPSSIDVVFLSHEHTDHVKSVHTFVKKYKVPLITSEQTFKAAKLDEKGVNDVYFVESGRVFSQFTGIDIFFMPISHDAVDPVGFVVYSHGVKFGLVTDLGYPTELVSHELKDCDALIVESNHEPELLKISSYPWELKQRIASRKGHLSNGDCAKLLKNVVSDKTKYVVLAHLSEENNNPDIAKFNAMYALKEFNLKLEVAEQSRPTSLFSVERFSNI